MKITDSEKHLSEENVAAFESRNGILLPEEYRDFLLRYNGGVPYPNYCRTESGVDVVVARFLSIGAANNVDDLDARCWSSAWPTDASSRMIQIGYDIGLQEIMLGVWGTYKDQVYIVIGNDGHLCARSFNVFIEMLENHHGCPVDESSAILDRIFGATDH